MVHLPEPVDTTTRQTTDILECLCCMYCTPTSLNFLSPFHFSTVIHPPPLSYLHSLTFTLLPSPSYLHSLTFTLLPSPSYLHPLTFTLLPSLSYLHSLTFTLLPSPSYRHSLTATLLPPLSYLHSLTSPPPPPHSSTFSLPSPDVVAKKWLELDRSEIEKQLLVISVHLFSPFLFGHAHQSDRWLRWCHEVGLLVSEL